MMTEAGRVFFQANEKITALETELAEVQSTLDDLIAFLKMASFRYGGRAVSKYAEGVHACAIQALDWIDKHQERT